MADFNVGDKLMQFIDELQKVQEQQRSAERDVRTSPQSTMTLGDPLVYSVTHTPAFNPAEKVPRGMMIRKPPTISAPPLSSTVMQGDPLTMSVPQRPPAGPAPRPPGPSLGPSPSQGMPQAVPGLGPAPAGPLPGSVASGPTPGLEQRAGILPDRQALLALIEQEVMKRKQQMQQSDPLIQQLVSGGMPRF